MGWYRPATRKKVSRYTSGGSSNRKMVRANRVVLHTAVSGADSLYPHFAVPGNAVSHFYVRKDGKVEQYIYTGFQSTANLDGNHDCITVETWDGYPRGWANGSDVPKWTRRQVKSLARLCAWAHKAHGIPLTPLSSSKPGTRGVGWHRQGVDPWRVSGGERWSTSYGKVCPGDRRVKQMPAIVRKARKYAKKGQPKPIKRWGPVNVWRVNRGLRGGRLTRATKRQMNRIVWAMRAQLGPNAVKGYKKHPRASLKRALRKFRKGDTEGMFSKGAGSRLKHLKHVFNRKK